MENKKFCKYCGEQIDKDTIVCTKCGRQLETVKKAEEKKEEQPQVQERPKFYTQSWFMWVLLIFFTPVGIFFMWKFHPEMKKNTKIILTIVFAIFFLLICFSPSGDDSNSESDLLNNNSNSNTSVEKKIEVIDLSKMKENDILIWCKEQNLNCRFEREYSDTIAKDKFIKQSVNPNEKVSENSSVVITYSLGKAPTKAEQNALKSAQSYLKYSAFSRKGLIEQLEYEGYTHTEAVYGVDHVGADWKEQAVKSAESYLRHSSFSRKGLIDQLEYEGFTHDQAVYGVTKNGL